MAKTKDTVEGSDEEEANESNEEATKEGDSKGVAVPEEFQKALYEVLDGATEEELDFASNCVSKKRMEMMKEDSMSEEGMPSD